MTDNNLELITSRLQEIIGLDELKDLLTKRSPNVYFGTAPTGRIHIGYLIPLLKIVDLLKAGCKVKILFADLHAVLDNLKSSPKVIDARTTYYEKMIRCILKNLNVQSNVESNLIFVKGSEFQLTPAYTKDLYHLSALTSSGQAKKAGAMVVKQVDNPKLSGLLYPLLQALDEEYLGADIQLGGIDQRKILTFASKALPLVGYKKRIHLMTPMLTSINANPENTNSENKMSSSDTNSKIDLLDSKNEIRKKINRAYCLEGDISLNPIMDLAKLIVFPLVANCNPDNQFVIKRHQKYGGPLIYTSYDKLESDFIDKKLHPQDLKMGIVDCLNDFLEPIRQEFSNKEAAQLMKKAY